MTELRALFDKYGCDKGAKHHYDTVYHPNLSALRSFPINVLEVGVFKGASTKAWLEYFPKATIYGIDTFERVAMESLDVWSHPRVKLMKADSTAPEAMLKVIAEWGQEIVFDVVIDDGLHTPTANYKTFRNLWPLMRKNGMYFVEDAWPLHLMNESQMAHPWVKSHAADYTKAAMKTFVDEVYRNTVIEYDMRKSSGEPDSYIFMVS